MRGVNKVILVGTLGRDPETKSFDNGGSICNFSIATSENWTDKNTGERKENTEWHRITLNNRLAEIAQQYLRKGSKIYLEGSLRTRKYTNKDGVEQSITEIRGDNFQMLDSRQDQSNSSDGYNSGSNQQSAPARNAPQNYDQSSYQQGYNNQSRASNAPSHNSFDSGLDDDLPF